VIENAKAKWFAQCCAGPKKKKEHGTIGSVLFLAKSPTGRIKTREPDKY
jgi:hypothetical protein